MPGVLLCGGLAACEQQFRREGFGAPGWRGLANSLRPGARQEEERTVGVAPGWQHEATDAVLIHFLETSVRPRLTLAEQALRSQGGAISGVPYTSFPQVQSRGSSHQCFGSFCNVGSGFPSLLPHAIVFAAVFSTFVAITWLLALWLEC